MGMLLRRYHNDKEVIEDTVEEVVEDTSEDVIEEVTEAIDEDRPKRTTRKNQKPNQNGD